MYLAVDSGVFRFGLRVYFVTALILIGIVGDRVCHMRTKLRLLRGQHVDVTHMTGWLKGSSSLKVCYQLRRLPCGWLGLSMIFAAILAILSDLGVSAFVRSAQHITRCSFQQGIVLAASTAASYPSLTGAAYFWAANAQLISSANAGFTGIYAKTDNSSGFCAGDEDILGFWHCNANGNPITYSTLVFKDDSDIVSDLQNQNLVYANWVQANVGPMLQADAAVDSQLVVVSASTMQDIGNAFDVKAAVDLRDNRDAKTKLMQAYQCSVSRDTTGMIANIHKQINITSTMNSWIFGIQGNLYLGLDQLQAVSDPAVVIEWMLNSMTMVSGGGQSISTPGNSGGTVGCVVVGTQLPGQIITLFLVVTLMAIILTANSVWLGLRIVAAKRGYDRNTYNPVTGRATAVDSTKICDSTPNGLVGWIQHAVWESPHSASTRVPPRGHHLRKWFFSVAHYNGQRIGVVSKEHTALSPTLSMESPPSYSGLGGMKDYTAVHTTEIR